MTIHRLRPALLLPALFCLLPLLGCGAGGPQLISTRDEIAIGQDAAAQLERRYGVVTDSTMNRRLDRIGRAIVSVAERRDQYPWRFRILNDPQVNAMALPGGFIYATRGLMTVSGLSDDELAGVIAHEVTHVSRRHSAKIMEQALGAQLLVGIATRGSSAAIRQASDLAVELVLLRGYRGYEYESDHWGTLYATRAGFAPAGLLNFMRELQAREGRDPARWATFLRTHPVTSERVKRLQDLVEQIRAGQVR